MRALPISAELEARARELKWMGAFQALAWGAVLAVLLGVAITGTLAQALHVLGPAPAQQWFAALGPALWLVSPVPSALATRFAQALRFELHPNVWSPSVIAFVSILAPFIAPAVVFSRLDDALLRHHPEASRTRGGWFAVAPVFLLPCWLVLGAFLGRDESAALVFGLFAASRVAWGALTVRACRSLLFRADARVVRAHADAPVAGG